MRAATEDNETLLSAEQDMTPKQKQNSGTMNGVFGLLGCPSLSSPFWLCLFVVCSSAPLPSSFSVCPVTVSSSFSILSNIHLTLPFLLHLRLFLLYCSFYYFFFFFNFIPFTPFLLPLSASLPPPSSCSGTKARPLHLYTPIPPPLLLPTRRNSRFRAASAAAQDDVVPRRRHGARAAKRL